MNGVVDTYGQMQARHKAELDKFSTEMHAISAAMSNLQQTNAAAQNNSLILAPNALADQILPLVEKSMHEKMKPLLLDASIDTQRMLAQHSEDIATGVLNKVAIAVQATETINTWLRSASSKATPTPPPS